MADRFYDTDEKEMEDESQPRIENNVQVLKTLLNMAALTFDFPESVAKLKLWTCILGMIVDVPSFRQELDELELLSSNVTILAAKSTGVILYSVSNCRRQCNVNLAVPTGSNALEQLLEYALHIMVSTYDDTCLNLRPLCSHVIDRTGPTCFRKCRIVPRSVQRNDVILSDDGTTICVQGRHVDVTVMKTSDMISRHTPITKMKLDDWPGKTYWCCTSCNKIVSFTNPPRLVLRAAPAPEFVDDLETIYSVCPEKLHHAIMGIRPDTIENTIAAITDVRIPIYVRTVFVDFSRWRFGIRDQILWLLGDIFTECDSFILQTPILFAEMLCMSRFMNEYTDVNVENTTRLATLLKGFQDQFAWRRFLMNSQYIHDWMKKSNVTMLTQAYQVFEACILPLVSYLHRTISMWSVDDREKVDFLLATRPEMIEESQTVSNISQHNAQLLREEREHKEADRKRSEASLILMQELLNESKTIESTTKKPKKKGKKQTAHKKLTTTSTDTTENDRGSPVQRFDNPKCVACLKRLREWIPEYHWEVIGSSVFFDGTDVDVVAVVDSESTLREVYDTVLSRTLFSRSYDFVDEEHVAILHGTFDEFPDINVDLQVCRKRGSSVAEIASRRAIALTKRLQKEVDEDVRQTICLLHQWCANVQLKGHKLCRLPGIAVTCIAITLACRKRKPTLNFLLHYLRDILMHSWCVIDFDAQECRTSGERLCPCEPLAVHVHGRNVTSRMTVAGTRHLLDVITWGVHHPSSCMPDLTPTSFQQWLLDNTQPVLKLRPLHPRSISHSLYAAVKRFDRHPLVNSVHLVEETCSQSVTLTLRVRFQSDTAFSKYGMDNNTYWAQAADNSYTHNPQLRLHEDGFVLFQKHNKRAWPIFVAREKVSCPARSLHATRFVNDRIRVEGAGDNASIPAIPCITVDALSNFDEDAWSPCWK